MPHDRILKAATGFHGHLGPWLALGLRAGRRARTVLGPNPFRLQALVRCPARTPYTCFLDGIQFGSGCTLGKGNIRHVPAARVRVEFRRSAAADCRYMPRSRGKADAVLRLELRPEVWAELHLEPARTRPAVERLGRAVFRRPLADLFLETRPA